MSTSQTFKAVAAAASVALLAGAFLAGPADAKRKKKPKPCAAFVPAEPAEGGEVTVVTDAATEEAPVEVEVATDPGLGIGRDDGLGTNTSEAWVPVQVDSKVSGAGLYGRVEFNPAWDYDLYLDDAAGTNLMSSGGFFVIDDAELGGDADNSETGAGFEAIYGITTEDCAGYLFDVAGATTPGGAVTLKLWLGEATL